MDPLSPTGTLASQGTRPALPPGAARVARQLEASFAAELLRAARPPRREGMFDRGAGAQAFDSFMDEALGEALVRRGGLGLVPAIEASIAQAQRRTPGAAAPGGTP